MASFSNTFEENEQEYYDWLVTEIGLVNTLKDMPLHGILMRVNADVQRQHTRDAACNMPLLPTIKGQDYVERVREELVKVGKSLVKLEEREEEAEKEV